MKKEKKENEHTAPRAVFDASCVGISGHEAQAWAC